MRRLLRIVQWLALGLGVFVLLVGIGLLAYTRTENFDRWARDQAISSINGLIRGSVDAERLDGSVWRHLILHNVSLQYQGREILKIPRLEISFSLLPLIWGEIRIASINAADPRASLVQDVAGRWNVIEALSPRKPEPETNSRFTVLVRSFRLQKAAVEVRPATNDNRTYYLRDLTMTGDVGVRPLGVLVSVGELDTVLSTAGQPELRLKGALEYEQAARTPAVLTVKNLWAVTRSSRAKFNAQLTQSEVLKIKAEAALDKLASSDIQDFVPQWPIKRDVTGDVSVDGPVDALKGNLRLTAAGAKMAAKFHANIAQETPRYAATATLDGFDLRQWINGGNFAGLVGGTITIDGSGFALLGLRAKAQLNVRSAEAQGWKLGHLSVHGELQHGIALLDGQLKSTMGDAGWSGKLTLAEKRPSYDLNLAVNNFDIQKIAQNERALKSELNFRGSIKGSGFNLAEMNTRADLKIAASSVGSITVKQGTLDLNVKENRIQIARLSLNAEDSMISATGAFGLGAQQAGKIDYRIRIGDIAPWMSLVNHNGSGAVDVRGLAQGSLADLEMRGTARLSGLRIDSVGVKDGSVGFALRGSKDQMFPRGTATARMIGVNAGVSLQRLDIGAKFSRQPQSIAFDVSAQDAHDRKHSIAGTLDLLSDKIALGLTQVSLTAPDGVWKLLRPALVTRQGDAFTIEQLTLRNAERQVFVNGRFALSGKQDLSLSVDRFPVRTLTGFLPEPPEMSGLIALHARISGTAGAPEITASARLSNPTIAGQAYAGADADAEYKDRKLSMRFVVRQDANHTLNGTGAVPLNLSWQNGWRMDFTDDRLEARAQSSGLSLAFLNAFGGKTVGNIAGDVSLDLNARGSVKAPNLSGQFRLRDGKFKVIPLGVDIKQIVVGGSLDSQSIRIREFSASADGGEIHGSGALPLTNYEQGAINLLLSIKNWPAIQTARYQAKIAGTIAAQGALIAPKVTGDITVVEGSLRPDLALLEKTKVPLKRDETIVVLSNAADREKRPLQTEKEIGSSDNQLFKKVSMDLTIRAPRNLWIRHPDLVSELSGNIQLKKEPDAAVDLIGRIDIVRGSLVFQGRRFQLSRGAIQFTGGGKINPALDITAEYKLPDYEVDAVLGGTADKPMLTLSSQPRLDQADILALLLFGRPVNALNQNQRGSVQQSALSITSGFVAGQLASSVSQALGLDTLGLDVGEVDASGGKLGFGHYLGDRTYFSVSQELSGQHGQDVSLDYQLAPNWKISTSRSSTGSNGIDIIWQKRY